MLSFVVPFFLITLILFAFFGSIKIKIESLEIEFPKKKDEGTNG